MDNQDLGRYQDMMPSRAVLARLSIFGTSEETRASANAILKALPPMNEKERREYLDETWRLADLPSEEDLLQSPIGRMTLQILDNSKPMSGEIPAEAMAALERLRSKPGPAAPAEPEAPLSIPDDGVNDYMKKLDWPPKSTPTPKLEPDEEPHKWVAGTPSTPSKDQTPVSDWNSDASNNPIY